MLILMSIFYREYCYIVPYILVFINIWTFFIKSNFLNVNIKPNAKDKIKPTNVIKKPHYSIFINWISVQFGLLFLNLFLIKGYSTTFLWNNFYLNNFNTYMVQITIILIYVLLIFSKTLVTNNINYNTDFFFSLSNTILFLILLSQANNLFCFIFILELNSITIFYKFVSSKYWYKVKKEVEESKFDLINRQIPKNYLNMLFFQYWSTFFSSVLIFFSLANIFYVYGSTDYVFVESINYINSNNPIIKYKFVLLVWLPFLLGFFIKIGLTPFHLFKIEVYKGLPIISIMFYTTLYFYVYFLYFILLMNYHIDFLKLIINSIFYITIVLGIIYIIALIFDITSLKSFFAYSTIINSLLFFIASYLL